MITTLIKLYTEYIMEEYNKPLPGTGTIKNHKMNNTIYKYPLTITDVNRIELPKGAKILCIQTQNDNPYLWALVDKYESEKETHFIETLGTGHPINEGERQYIGTYQLRNGALVFHVFLLADQLQEDDREDHTDAFIMDINPKP